MIHDKLNGMRLLPVTPESPVNFLCQTCGECCSGSMRVRLAPEDLYRMARFLNMTNTSELFREGYVHWRRGPGGYDTPFIRFRRNPFPFCPFLENRLTGAGKIQGLCRLHPDHKPMICALSPAGRCYESESGEETFYYIPPHPGCPGDDKGMPAPLSELISPVRQRMIRENDLFTALDRLHPVLHRQRIRELYLFDVREDFVRSWNSPDPEAAGTDAGQKRQRRP